MVNKGTIECNSILLLSWLDFMTVSLQLPGSSGRGQTESEYAL